MKICERFSTLSYDTKYQVGACLVSNDFSNIHSVGYNGNAKGLCNERNSLLSGDSGFIHAEENVILKSSLKSYEYQYYTLFITHNPCEHCSKVLINANIQNIVYLNTYNNCGQAFENFEQCKVNIKSLYQIFKEYYFTSKFADEAISYKGDFFDLMLIQLIKILNKSINVTDIEYVELNESSYVQELFKNLYNKI
jgi:dCMP deaminase